MWFVCGFLLPWLGTDVACVWMGRAVMVSGQVSGTFFSSHLIPTLLCFRPCTVRTGHVDVLNLCVAQFEPDSG